MENLKEKFLKWKEATFESMGLRVNIKKTKVIESGSNGDVLKSKVDPCAKGSDRVMANLVMCTKCGKWQMHENEKSDFNSCKRFCL